MNLIFGPFARNLKRYTRYLDIDDVVGFPLGNQEIVRNGQMVSIQNNVMELQMENEEDTIRLDHLLNHIEGIYYFDRNVGGLQHPKI